VSPTAFEAPKRSAHRAKRVLLAAATALLAINIWTGAPLLALWIGSVVVGKTQLTIQAVFIVVAVLALLVFAMLLALVNLNAAYDRLIGRQTRERRFTWLRSMRAEARREEDLEIGVTALEQIVMFTVWVAVIALVVWFFAFAKSPLPHG
jgi:MFS family permease